MHRAVVQSALKSVVKIGVVVTPIREARPPLYSAFGLGKIRDKVWTAGCKVVVEIGVAVNPIQEAKPPFYSAFGLGKYRDK
jgi:hypothetical protein